MASVIKCDMCGYTSITTTDFRHIRVHLMKSPTEYFSRTLKYFDLCMKCYDKIFDFRNSNEGGEDEYN